MITQSVSMIPMSTCKKASKKILVVLLIMALLLLNLAMPVEAAIGTGSSTNANSGTGYTVTIAKPTGTVAGDVLVACILATSGDAARPDVTPPAGWQLIRHTDATQSFYYDMVTYYKVAGTSEPGDYTWTSTKFNMSGGITRLTGVDINHVIDVSADAQGSGGSPATATAPSVTTTYANDIVINFFGSYSPLSTPCFFEEMSLDPLYEYAPQRSGSYYPPNIAAYGWTKSSAAATGSKACALISTSPTTVQWVAQTVALKAAPRAYFSVTATSAEEADSNRSVGVTLAPDAEGPVEINFTVSGTATPGKDYTMTTNSPVTVGTGNGATSIAFTILEDSLYEEDETIIITLIGGQEYYLSTYTQYVFTITNDDLSAPAAVITAGDSRTGTSPDTGYTFPVPDTARVIQMYKPTGTVAGDFLLAAISWHSSLYSSIPTPAGWHHIRTTYADGIWVSTYYRITDGSDASVSVYTFDLSDNSDMNGWHATGGITRYTGIDTVTPIDVSDGAGGHAAYGSTISAPSVHPNYANSRIVSVFGTYHPVENISTPSGMTERYEVHHHIDPNNSYYLIWPEIAVSDMNWAPATATGLKQATITANSPTPIGSATDWAAQTIALKTSQLSINDVSITEGNSGSSVVNLTVSLDHPTNVPVTFNWSTANGTAVASYPNQPGDDYMVSSGTGYPIPAGQTSYSIGIPVMGDTALESNETFYVNITGATGATIADAQGAVTILDNDSSVTINNVSQNEGNTGTTNFNFTVTLNPVCSVPVSVNYFTPTEGTAQQSTDYYYTPGTVEFAAGEITKTISVPVVGDTVYEPDETFVVYLSSATNARITDDRGTGTITNDDAPIPTISINDVSRAEGTSGPANMVFTVTLSNASASAVAVNYTTANGTATAGTDYTLTAGTLNIAAGLTSGTISVPIIGDTAYEANETFSLVLSSPVNATINDGTGIGTITNDDVLTMSIGDVSLAEGNSGVTNFNFPVTLNGASTSTVTVNYSATGGTATPGPDYNSIATATLTFNPGETSKSITVQVNGETAYEPDETFFVNLSNASGAVIMDAQAVGTILNDDAIPTYALTMAVSPGSSGSAADQTGTSPYVTGTVVNIRALPATGYHFVNWTAPAGSFADANAATTTFTMPAAAVTVTANFAPDTYTVTFDSQGGSAVSNQTIAHGGLVVKPANPVRSGYAFAGWYKAVDYSDDWIFTADTVTANITLYARWTFEGTAPVVSTNPTNQSITYGANASFASAATGTPSPTVQWEVSTDGGSHFSNISDGGVYSGAATTTLNLTRPPVSYSSYQYRAVFANGIAPEATTTVATLTVAKLGITGSFTADNKTYDGNTAATVLSRSLTGVLSDDAVTLTGGTAAFADKNAGTGKSVTLTGAELSGLDAGNYNLTSVATTTANITPKPVVPVIVANDKTYDGTTTATTSSKTVSGAIGSDAVDLTVGEANFADEDVGTWTVTATSLGLGGADAANYTLSAATATDTATITALGLTISGAVAKDKDYDGTMAATVDFSGASLTGVHGTDVVSIDSAAYTAAFNDKNVDDAKTVTVLGVALSGADAANYTVAQPIGLTADITPLGITGSFTADNKTYDGNTAATVLSRSLTGVLSDDAVSLTGGMAAFADKNAGPSKTVTLTGAALAGADAGNYSLASIATAKADISPKPVTPAIVANDKAYDGTTIATTSSKTVSGAIGSDAVDLTVGEANFADENVGTWTVTATSLGLGGADAANYALSAATATDTATITALALTISGAVAKDKDYDGNDIATVDFTGATLAGVHGTDTVGIDTTGCTATFDNKNAGDAKPVTVKGIALSGADAANYTVAQPDGLTADITPLGITGSFTADNKTYDGNTAATVFSRSLTGVLSDDAVSLTGGTAAFADKNAGPGKTVTLTGGTLSGTDAGNYTLTSVGATTADISPKPVTPAIVANDKAYDGTTTATTSSKTVSGAIGSDAVDLTVGEANFSNEDVGTWTVTATSLGLGGADAANYTLSAATATDTAAITPLGLTISGAIAKDKDYDGNDIATVDFTGASLTGVHGTDAVGIDSTSYTATFDNKNAGDAKPVTVKGIALNGADAANYTVAQPSGLTADIMPLGITGSFTADSKTYDGTTGATVLSRSLVGILAGDAVSLTGSTAAFADKNAGLGKTVTLTGATLSGMDAGNYSLTSVATTTSDISPKPVAPAIVANDKAYDGTTAATLSSQTVSGAIGSDILKLVVGSATFADKDVGNWTVTATSLSLGGADAANYALSAATATDTATITPLGLTISGAVANDKIYDSKTTATVDFTGATLAGVVGSDVVGIDSTGYTAAFNNKNVDQNKPVTVQGCALSGADAVNYTVSQPGGLTADITPLGITGNFTAANKVYDGTTSAIVSGRSLTGVLSGDVVSLTGGTAAFADKNAGIDKTVTLTGAALSGADAGNYSLTSVATAKANIDVRPIIVTAIADTKTYDGTTSSDGVPTITSSLGLAAGDSAAWKQTFDTKDAGTGKVLTPAGTVQDGNGGGNYQVSFVAVSTGIIEKAKLTVTAENKTSQYSDARLAFTAALSGFIPGETLATSGVTGLPAYTTSPALSNPITQAPGGYSIIPSLGTLAAINYSFTFVNGTYTVTKEDAAITFDSQNPVSVKVVAANGSNSAFIWNVKISQNDSSQGNLNLINPSDISLAFSAVGSGGGLTVKATNFDPNTGIATFTIPENKLGVETYSAVVSLGNACFEAPSIENVLVIYDPSLGFTTGGGWFIWPASATNPELEGAKTNFGFTMKYNRKGASVQGSFLLIAHLTDGSIIRIKSNAVYGMAIIKDTYPGIATFSGKCVYSRIDAQGNVLASAGNQDFIAYVKDGNEPGTGTDMFWFNTRLTITGEKPFSLDSNKNTKAEDAECVSLGGGNIVVPHKASSEGVIDEELPPIGGKKK